MRAGAWRHEWIRSLAVLLAFSAAPAAAAPFDVIIVPDQQCIVERNRFHCVHHLTKKFGVHSTLPPYKDADPQLFYAAFRQLQQRPDYKKALAAQFAQRLDAWDAAVRWILEHRPALVMNMGDSIDQGMKLCSAYAAKPRVVRKIEDQWDLFMHNRDRRKGYQAIIDAGIPQVSAQGNHDLCGFVERLRGNSPDGMAYAIEFSAGGRRALALATPWSLAPQTQKWLDEQMNSFDGPMFFASHLMAVPRKNVCTGAGGAFGMVMNHADEVVLASGGHVKGRDCKGLAQGKKGAVVLNLTNWQSAPLGGAGHLGWARVFPEESRFEIRTFSPYKGHTWETALKRPGETGLAGPLDATPFLPAQTTEAEQ